MASSPRTASLALCALVVLALVWVACRRIASQEAEIHTLRSEIAEAGKQRDEAMAKVAMRLKDNSRPPGESKGGTLPPAAAFGEAFDAWMGKVRRLFAYLAMHPERRIPQMDALTAADWLDVTKNKDLETEADFREALAKLRGLARQKFANDIGKALERAMAEDGGRPPSDPQALAAYVPAGIDQSILRQLAVNATGVMPGLKILGATEQFYLVDKPVDDLWDSTLFYSPNGGAGVRAAGAMGENSVAAAIAQYTKANGVPPTSAYQLSQYPGISAIDQADLDEMFKAMTTKPGL
jgi:hypothetical protein